MPGDVLDSFREGDAYERAAKWSDLVPHHPIYYAEFADLKKVIERKDNWRDLFMPLFGKKKEIFTGVLSSLEPIRNKVAHNRRATATDLAALEDALHKICAALGKGLFCDLVARCTSAKSLVESFSLLQKEARSAAECVRLCAELVALPSWEHVRSQWWFDEDCLSHPVESVASYFGALADYIALPRQRGSGHLIETWAKEKDIEGKYVEASATLASLLEKARKD